MPITLDVLDDLDRLALNCPFDFTPNGYRVTQQALTLYALLEYFKERGIDLPFHLEIPFHEPPKNKAVTGDDD